MYSSCSSLLVGPCLIFCLCNTCLCLLLLDETAWDLAYTLAKKRNNTATISMRYGAFKELIALSVKGRPAILLFHDLAAQETFSRTTIMKDYGRPKLLQSHCSERSVAVLHLVCRLSRKWQLRGCRR